MLASSLSLCRHRAPSATAALAFGPCRRALAHHDHAHRLATVSPSALIQPRRHPWHLICRTSSSLPPPVDPPTSQSTPPPSATNRFRPVPQLSLAQLLPVYNELSKAKLASLVTLTTMVGYALAPTAASVTTLLATTVGTHLTITSANTFNQLMESPYDAQMARTRNRPLVRHAITPHHALAFAVCTGVAGVSTLALLVNPLTATLGAANLVLYSFIYTPMKRMSIANTWVGALVGAIPPMMGWTACTNSLHLVDDFGAYVLGFLLYAWQFPHFNSLSWNIRADYSKAGYRMMAVTDPALNARVSLRYALAMLPVPFITSYAGLTTWWFLGSSSLVNGAMALYAYRFWRERNDKHARELFFSSLVHLPVILGAMLVHRKPREDEVGVVDRIKYALGMDVAAKATVAVKKKQVMKPAAEQGASPVAVAVPAATPVSVSA